MSKRIKGRCDDTPADRGAADTLVYVYELVVAQLSHLLDFGPEAFSSFSPNKQASLQDELQSLLTFLSQGEQKLSRKFDTLGTTYRSARRSLPDAPPMADLNRDAASARESLDRIDTLLTVVERVDRTSAASNGARHPDVFRACNTAPRNPKSVVIDFESTDSEGNPATLEGKLKAVLLRSETSRSFGAIAQGMGGVGKTCALRALAADRNVMARFPGGIYFMSLGADASTKDVIEELAGAVDASGGASISLEMRREKNLTRAVQKAQGWFSGSCCLFIFDDLWALRDTKDSILLQLSVLVSLCGGHNSTSCLLYSTRDQSLSLQGETVAFEPRDPLGKTAMAILARAAGAEREELEEPVCQPAINRILGKCSGLPVSLNLCGTNIRLMRSRWTEDKKEVWGEYWRKLEAKTLLSTSADAYGSLDVALQVSIEYLDGEASETGMFLKMSHRKMHRALCILRKQDWVSVCILQKLWGLLDRKCTEHVVNDMANVGIVYAEHRKVADDTKILGLRLHDLVHDFALQEARKHGEERLWPGDLIDIYEDAQDSKEPAPLWAVSINSNKDTGYMTRNVCRLLNEARRFHDVERLFHSARWSVKMLETNNVSQLEQDVRQFLECCVRRCSQEGTQGDSGMSVLEDEEKERWLKALCKIVRQSAPFCAQNTHGAWFQLHARLMATRDKPPWMKEMMNEVEVYAPRPLLKALVPCLKGANDALVDTYMTECPVRAAEFVNDDIISLQWWGHSDEFLVERHSVSGESEVHRLKRSPSRILKNETPTCSNRKLSESHASRNAQMSCGRLLRKGLRALPGRCFRVDDDDICSESPSEVVSDAVDVTELNDHVKCGAICKNGLWVATGWYSGTVGVFSVSTGEIVWEVTDGHSAAVECIAASQDGSHIASGSEDKTVRVWEARTGREVCQALTGHTQEVLSIALSSDGRFVVSGSSDKTVRVWNVLTEQAVGSAFVRHTDVVTAVAMSRSGHMTVSGSSNATVQLWNVKDGRQVGQLAGQSASPSPGGPWSVFCVAISADSLTVASGLGDNTIRVWNAETWKQIGSALTGHSHNVGCVAVSADGSRVVSGSTDHSVRVWDVESLRRAGPALTRHFDAVNQIAVSADGQRVVSGSDDGVVRVWDAESGKQVVVCTGHTNVVWSVAMSADGQRVVSGSTDATVRVWDGESGAQVFPALTGHTGAVVGVAVSADGRKAVSGSEDHTVRVWDAESGEQVGSAFTGHTSSVRCVALSADGHRVVSGSDDETVRVWDVERGLLLGTLTGHTARLTRVAMDADGRRVLSDSHSISDMRLWDAESGTCLRLLDEPHLFRRWGFLCKQLRERPDDIQHDLPDYVARNRDVIFRDGVSEKVVATLEGDIYDLHVTSQHRTVVAHVFGSVLAFLRIVD